MLVSYSAAPAQCSPPEELGYSYCRICHYQSVILINRELIDDSGIRPRNPESHRIPVQLGSTMLRSLKVDVKVQQELLRHADIRTTMNLYTQAIPDDMREANSQAARMVLPRKPE